jgi:hypothetical protein
MRNAMCDACGAAPMRTGQSNPVAGPSIVASWRACVLTAASVTMAVDAVSVNVPARRSTRTGCGTIAMGSGVWPVRAASSSDAALSLMCITQTP